MCVTHAIGPSYSNCGASQINHERTGHMDTDYQFRLTILANGLVLWPLCPSSSIAGPAVHIHGRPAEEVVSTGRRVRRA